MPRRPRRRTGLERDLDGDQGSQGWLSTCPPRYGTPLRRWSAWRQPGSLWAADPQGVLWYLPTPKLGLFYLDDGRTLIVSTPAVFVIRYSRSGCAGHLTDAGPSITHFGRNRDPRAESEALRTMTGPSRPQEDVRP